MRKLLLLAAISGMTLGSAAVSAEQVTYKMTGTITTVQDSGREFKAFGEVDEDVLEGTAITATIQLDTDTLGNDAYPGNDQKVYYKYADSALAIQVRLEHNGKSFIFTQEKTDHEIGYRVSEFISLNVDGYNDVLDALQFKKEVKKSADNGNYYSRNSLRINATQEDFLLSTDVQDPLYFSRTTDNTSRSNLFITKNLNKGSYETYGSLSFTVDTLEKVSHCE